MSSSSIELLFIAKSVGRCSLKYLIKAINLREIECLKINISNIYSINILERTLYIKFKFN